eukprot:CAMPEP_0173397740 /NCGR_PEP_ID=MMETSP1356-20130122/39368_1 /TAXON_ID=77927 ORGANISM="Hemiselmis virescens, Strain PCC157" /NCGR_SAMPLE_ID=MMETSP1356 /ASSEMBLY_ACC=CAM_ASM_000847 /LENGTH=41 /DNA_ID= /DNA_START= /DNA_END= /DNA_ORIENTATION=
METYVETYVSSGEIWMSQKSATGRKPAIFKENPAVFGGKPA